MYEKNSLKYCMKKKIICKLIQVHSLLVIYKSRDYSINEFLNWTKNCVNLLGLLSFRSRRANPVKRWSIKKENFKFILNGKAPKRGFITWQNQDEQINMTEPWQRQTLFFEFDRNWNWQTLWNWQTSFCSSCCFTDE